MSATTTITIKMRAGKLVTLEWGSVKPNDVRDHRRVARDLAKAVEELLATAITEADFAGYLYGAARTKTPKKKREKHRAL